MKLFDAPYVCNIDFTAPLPQGVTNLNDEPILGVHGENFESQQSCLLKVIRDHTIYGYRRTSIQPNTALTTTAEYKDPNVGGPVILTHLLSVKNGMDLGLV